MTLDDLYIASGDPTYLVGAEHLAILKGDRIGPPLPTLRVLSTLLEPLLEEGNGQIEWAESAWNNEGGVPFIRASLVEPWDDLLWELWYATGQNEEFELHSLDQSSICTECYLGIDHCEDALSSSRPYWLGEGEILCPNCAREDHRVEVWEEWFDESQYLPDWWGNLTLEGEVAGFDARIPLRDGYSAVVLDLRTRYAPIIPDEEQDPWFLTNQGIAFREYLQVHPHYKQAHGVFYSTSACYGYRYNTEWQGNSVKNDRIWIEVPNSELGPEVPLECRGYHSFWDFDHQEGHGSFEVVEFQLGDEAVDDEGNPYDPGWYWVAGFPGCLWDGDPQGPFDTPEDAWNNAIWSE